MAKRERRTLKATFTLDVELVARLNACATIRNTSRDALVTGAIEEVCKGLVLFDRAKSAVRSNTSRAMSEVSASSEGSASESAEPMAATG